MRRVLLVLTIAALVASGCGDDKKTATPADQVTTPTTPAVSDADIAKAVDAITDRKADEPKFISEDQARCLATDALPNLSDTGKGYLTAGIKNEGDGESATTGSSGGTGKSTTTTTGKKSTTTSGSDTRFKDLDDADAKVVVSAFSKCLPLADLLKAVIGSALSSVDLGQKEIDCTTDKVKPDYDGSGDLFKVMVSEDKTAIVKVLRVGFKCLDESNQKSALGELFSSVSSDPSVGTCLADLAVTNDQAADLFASLIAGEKDKFTTFLTTNGSECGFDTSGGDPSGGDPSGGVGTGIGNGIGSSSFTPIGDSI